MATTEVDTADTIPLTTMQKIEVEDKELLTSEYDQKADLLSKDELKNIESELTKALETVEQSGYGDAETTHVQNETTVREFETENDGVPEGGILETASVPEVAEEKTFTEHVDTVNAEKDELRVDEKLGKLDESSIVKKEIKGTEEQGEALPCPGNVDKGKSEADEPAGSQFDEQVPSAVGQTPSDTVEVETQAVAKGSSYDIEEQKTVSVPAEQKEEDAKVDAMGEHEKTVDSEAREISISENEAEVCSRPESVPNAPHDEENLEVAKEEGIKENLSASKTDLDDTERENYVEVQATSTDSHVQEKVPDILIHSEDGVHIQAEEMKIEDTQIYSIQTETDLDEAEASNIADKIITDVDEEITIKEQHGEEADTNVTELTSTNETDTMILEETDNAEVASPTKEGLTTVGEKKILAESDQIDENSTGMHESLVEDAKAPETEEEKDKVSLNEELETGNLHFPELEKTQEADTAHTSIVKDTKAETAGDAQVTEEPEDAVEGVQAATDSREEKNENEPSPTSNVKQLLQDEENKVEAIIEEVNYQPGSTSIDGSVEEQTNIVGQPSTESHEEGVTVVSLDNKKEDSNNREISDHITEVSETKDEPEKSTSENDNPEVEVPESSSIFTSETPEELVASDDVFGVRVNTADEEADKIEEQGADTTDYKASEAESAREMNFVLNETSENTGITEAEILDKNADEKEIILAPREGVTNDAGEVVISKEENYEGSAASKTADMTSAKNTNETEETGELKSEKIIELEKLHDIDSRKICIAEDGEIMKDESIEISERDDMISRSMVTADDSSSELPQLAERSQKETSLGEKDAEKITQIDETQEIVEPVPDVIPAEIEKDGPADNEDKSKSLDVKEPVEDVAQIVETCKVEDDENTEIIEKDHTNNSSLPVTADDNSTELPPSVDSRQKEASVNEEDDEKTVQIDETLELEPVIQADIEDVPAKDEGNSTSLNVEEPVENAVHISETCKVEENETNQVENIEISETDDANNSSFTVTGEESSSELPALSNQKETSFHEEEDEKTAHIEETPETAEPIAVVIPAEIEENVQSKDEEKSTSLNVEETVENVADIVQTPKEDLKNESESEVVHDQLTLVSRGDLSGDVADTTEEKLDVVEQSVTLEAKEAETGENKEENATIEDSLICQPSELSESAEGNNIDKTVEESTSEDATKLDELIEIESPIHTHDSQEASRQVEQIEEAASLDQIEIQVEKEPEVVAEPDPDEAQKLKHAAEPAETSAEGNTIDKNVEESTAEDAIKLDELNETGSRIQTHDGDEVSKHLEQIEETASLNQTEIQVEKELEVVAEQDPDDSEKLEKLSEPDPEEAQKLKRVAEAADISEEGNTIDKTVEESTAKDATKLNELIETESPIQTHISEEASKQVEQTKEAASPDQIEIQVEKEPEVVAEPDLDDSEKRENLSEQDSEEAQKLKQVAEQDPEESQNLERISEPDPDSSEKLKQVSELDTEILQQVSEPGQDETEILKQVSEPDAYGSESLKVSEPNLNDSENLKIAPEHPDYENQEKADKTEVTEDYEEVTNKDYLMGTSKVILENTDELARETAVSNEVDAVGLVDIVPELSVESSIHEEVSSCQIPELRTEEKSEPKTIVNSQTTQETITESDVEHIDTIKEVEGAEGLLPPANASATDIKPSEENKDNVNKEEEIEDVAANVNKGDFEIPLTDVPEVGKQVEYEIQKDEAGQEVILQDKEPGEELKNLPQEAEEPELPGPSANDGEISILECKEVTGEVLEEEKPKDEIEDDGSVKEKITVSEVQVTPDDQGEEIEHLSSKAVDFELATSILNDENISNLKREEVSEEVLEEEQKDDVSPENEKSSKEVLKAEDEQEVTKCVQNKTEDSELSTSSVSDEKIPGEEESEAVAQDMKEKDGPKDDDNVEEKNTTNEVLVQEDKQVQSDQIPNELAESESSPSILNNEDITNHEGERGPEEVQEKLSAENHPEDEQVVTEVSEIYNSSVNDDKHRGEEAPEAVPEDGKENDARKDKEIVEDTADKAIVQEDEQAQLDQLPDGQSQIDRFINELEEKESSVPSLNNGDTTLLEHGQDLEEVQEKLSETNQPENEDKVAEAEIAHGAVDEQGDESVLIHLPNEAEGTENQILASCVDDDNIAPKAEEVKEEGNEKYQAQENDIVQEIEAATEVIVQEDEQGEQLKLSQCADKETESSTSTPGVNDDEIAIPKNDLGPEIVLEEDQEKYEDMKEMETINEELVQKSKGVELKHSQSEIGEAEPSGRNEPEENLHEEKVADLVNDETEEKEREKETLGQEYEQGQLGHLSGNTENLEISVPYADDKNQTSLTNKEALDEESPNDHIEIDVIAEETEQAEYDTKLKKRETAKEVLEQEISQEGEIDLPNKIAEAESSIATASVDETVILRGQDPEEEERIKDQVINEKDLGSSIEELESNTTDTVSKNKLESKEPESVEGNTNKEDSRLEDNGSQTALENKVETSISEIEQSNTVDEETQTTDETEIIDKLHETSVEKAIDEDITVSETLPSTEDKSSDEDVKALTETGPHESNKLESLSSVETAKEANEKMLENITHVAGEVDKKDMVYTETQGEILEGSEGNDVLTQGDKNDYPNDLLTVITEENNLQTVEVPTHAADDEEDTSPKETVDGVPPENLELQDIATFHDEGQKKLINSETASDEFTEKVYVPLESPTSSSILQEEKNVPKEDTETTIPNDISLVENAVKIEDFADKEPQTAEEDDIHVEDNACAGSAVVETVEISSSVPDRDEEIKQELERDGEGILETIKEKSSLGLEDATLATSEIPVNEEVPEESAVGLESGNIVEEIIKEDTTMVETNSDSTEETSYNERKNHEPLSLSPKPEEVDAADVVEIREALNEQNCQEKYIENITSDTHEDNNQAEERHDDSPSETVIEPVKLQELEADNIGDEKNEEVKTIELDKEEINTQIETPPNSSKEVDVNEMQFQEAMTVVTDGDSDKSTTDQSIKREVSEKIPEETKVSTESPQVSVRKVYAGEEQQIHETLAEELAKDFPEDKTEETKETGANEYLGESKDEGIQDPNTTDVKGNELEEHDLDKADGSSTSDAAIKVNLTDRDAPKVDGTPSEQVEIPDVPLDKLDTNKLETRESDEETRETNPVECISIESGIEGTTCNDPIVLASIKDDSKPSSETEIPSNTLDNKDEDFQFQELVTPQNKISIAQSEGNDSNLATAQPELNTSKAISGEVFNAEENPREDPALSTGIKDIPTETEQSTTRSLDYEDVVRPESTNDKTDKVKMQPENAKLEKTSQEIEKEIELHNPLNIPAENSLNDLLQISTKDTIQMAREPTQETNQTPKKETLQKEDPKTDEDKDDEEDEEGEEHKKTDSSSDGVIVEASRDLDVKSPEKKHHGILSGVGIKVKNSISKVKKAITGKSSHTKPPSPK